MSGQGVTSHIIQLPAVYSAFILVFVLGTHRLREAGTLNSRPPYLTGVVFHCVISLLMVANVRLKRGTQREALGTSCAILAQPPSQSKCK